MLKEEIQYILKAVYGFRPYLKDITGAEEHCNEEGEIIINFKIIREKYVYYYTLRTNYWDVETHLPNKCEVSIVKKSIYDN